MEKEIADQLDLRSCLFARVCRPTEAKLAGSSAFVWQGQPQTQFPMLEDAVTSAVRVSLARFASESKCEVTSRGVSGQG